MGKDHPSTATTYNNIALVYDEQGEYSEALKWYEKALSIYEKVLGKDHPSTATTYHNIASVYDHQGEYPQALEMQQEALRIFRKVLGDNHPDTILFRKNMDMLIELMNENKLETD